MGDRLGLVSVSFRQNTAEEILKAVRNAGLSCVEWGSDVHAPCEDEKTLREIAALQKTYGISCCSYGTYFKVGENDVSEIEQYIKAAKLLGTNILRIWCGNKDFRAYSDGELHSCLAECKRLADIAEKNGVCLCAECHNHTVTSCAEGGMWLMREINSPAFFMYWQPNQFMTFDENLNYAKQIAGYTKHIHVFHWTESERKSLADGVADWKRYLSCFQKDKTLLLEFMPDDRMDSLAKETQALKEIAGV